MKSGEQWAYRPKPKDLGAAVRRVEVVRVGLRGSPQAPHVRFLDGDDAGLQEWVPQSSLVTPWKEVEAFRADDNREFEITQASRSVRGSEEFEAARLVLGLVRPRNLLRLRHGVADAGVLDIHRLDEAAQLLATDPDELRKEPLLHETRAGSWVAGWPITERFAHHVAHERAEEVLLEVDRRQEAAEEKRSPRSYGYYGRSHSHSDERKLDLEIRALRTVRDWCGGEKTERHDELVALRAEVIRLGELVERAVKALRESKRASIAATIERDLGVHVSSLRSAARR